MNAGISCVRMVDLSDYAPCKPFRSLPSIITLLSKMWLRPGSKQPSNILHTSSSRGTHFLQEGENIEAFADRVCDHRSANATKSSMRCGRNITLNKHRILINMIVGYLIFWYGRGWSTYSVLYYRGDCTCQELHKSVRRAKLFQAVFLGAPK